MAGTPPIQDPDLFLATLDSIMDDDDAGDGEVQESEEQKYNTLAKTTGLKTITQLENSDATIEAMLQQAGVDIEHPQVQVIIQSYGDMLKDPALAPAMIVDLAANFPAVPRQAYDDALAASGFQGAFMPAVEPGGMAALTSGTDAQIAQFRRQTPNFETQPDTGWIRFQNGVLVSPDGQVAFDPTSAAPGSIRWQREVVSKWGDDKVAEWRKRLHEQGYLTKDQMKVKGTDTVFLEALSAYHISRYANGGKPVAGDLAGVAGAGGAGKPPLMNFEDMGAQIRNDVREQYRRIFGEDPSDGEVTAWSDYIIRTGMSLQKKYRRKDYGSYSSMAATEAEEMFIEKLENSPQAQFLADSTEENTALRDALQQSVIVANSLGG